MPTPSEPTNIEVDDTPTETAEFQAETTAALRAKASLPAEDAPPVGDDESRFGGEMQVVERLSPAETQAAMERVLGGGAL